MIFLSLDHSTHLLQDVKDKAKAFIKRKIEQLTQEHAAALASSAQQISDLIAARNLAERERDDVSTQRDELRQQLRASTAAFSSASIPPQNASEDEVAARAAEDATHARSELLKLRAELAMSQRKHAEAVDAAEAADAFRQKQLEIEKHRAAEELQAERKRSAAAVSDAETKFLEAIAKTQAAAATATMNAAPSDCCEINALQARLKETQAAADVAAATATAAEMQIQELRATIDGLESVLPNFDAFDPHIVALMTPIRPFSPLLSRYAARISGASADAVTSRATHASSAATAEIEALNLLLAELKGQLKEVPELKAQVARLAADAASASVAAAASDERFAAAADSARITSERNFQLERESRELLQVAGKALNCSHSTQNLRSRICWQTTVSFMVYYLGASRKRCYGGTFRRRAGGCQSAGKSCRRQVQRARQG